MKTIASLGDIAEHYDAVICDVWGVIHDGKTAFQDACNALRQFRDTRGPVLLLSNAARPGHAVAGQLDDLQIDRDTYDGILTAGDATRIDLEARGDQPFYHLGPDRDRSIWGGLKVREAPLEEATFILNTGLVDDEKETPDNYKDLLDQSLDLALPMICANPDHVVHRGAKLIWCAGALADAYERLGGTVTYYGKPHPAVYDLALKQLGEITGKTLDQTRILAIGDSMGTDVLGANRAGIDVLFISAGIHAEKFGKPEAPDHALIVNELDSQEVFASGSMPRLKW